jgi:Ca-activated chloride channel homolog
MYTLKRILFVLLLTPWLVSFSCAKKPFVILSGSENESLEPLVKTFGLRNGFDIHMQYKGSVDVMTSLQSAETSADSIWPASSLWISLGDKNKRVKYAKSVMASPVVWGIQRDIAEKLGFIDQPVRVKDILVAVRDKKLKFLMTSATQSNSGAMAYLGFLFALLGNPSSITDKDLSRADVTTGLGQIFQGVERSSGSSGWLKELFLKGDYTAMVNYESLLIETNQVLISLRKTPLYLIYPIDGIVMADSPIGFISHGDSRKEEFFRKLQSYLLSDEVQGELLKMGRRTGFGGVLENTDPNVFNPNWGIHPEKVLTTIALPQSEIIWSALNLYQSEVRKPSYTVFCLDFSSSMSGPGEDLLKKAMRLILDPESAKEHLLQSTKKDRIVIYPFSSKVWSPIPVASANPKSLDEALHKINALMPEGQTDIFSCAMEAFTHLSNQKDLSHFVPSVILMTDGHSNTGKQLSDLGALAQEYGNRIPIFPIYFGAADLKQLESIADLTSGRVFDGTNDLTNAFRHAKGYN